MLQPIVLVVLAVTLFGVMDGLGKFLADDYSVAQIVWARYAFALPVVLATSRPSSWPLLLKAERPLLQVVRGVLPVVASLSIVTGLGLMPLADATAITFAAPLLVVALSVPLLGERVPIHSWIGVACGFAGVLLVVRPGAGAIAWAALFPLATACLFALYQIMTRIVGRGDTPTVTLAWTMAVGFVLTTPLLPFFWNPVAPLDWLMLVFTGLLFGAAHFMLIKAFVAAPAAVLAPFTYAQIIAAVAFGVAVFGDLPDIWTVAGTMVLVLSGLYVLRRQAVDSARGRQAVDSAGA